MPPALRYDNLPQEIRTLITRTTINQTWYEEDRAVLPAFDYRLGLLCRKTRGDPAAALLNMDWIQITVIYSTDDRSTADAKEFGQEVLEILPSALPNVYHSQTKKPLLFLTMRIGLSFADWRPAKEAKYLIPFDQREICGIGRLVTINEHTARLTRLELVTPQSRSMQSIQHELLPLVALVRNCANSRNLVINRQSEYVVGLDKYHAKLLETMMVTRGFFAYQYIVWLEEIIKFVEYMYSISFGHGERACLEAVRMLNTSPETYRRRYRDTSPEMYRRGYRVEQITQHPSEPDNNQAAFLMCKLALLSLQKHNERWEKMYQPGMTYEELVERHRFLQNRAVGAIRFIGLHGRDRELVHVQAGQMYYNFARLIYYHFPEEQAEFIRALQEAGIHFQSGAMISSREHTFLAHLNTLLPQYGHAPVNKEDVKAKFNYIGGVKERIPDFVRAIWDDTGRFWGVQRMRTRNVLRPEQQQYPHNWQNFILQWFADGPLI